MERKQLSVMFLGTASGGGPSDTRNCSALVCDFLADYSLWLVDCAEGTIRQFANQPQQGFRYRPHKVSKIFITHMHADHIMGIVPFLRGVLGIPEAGASPAYCLNPATPKVEIYGPAGLRTFVRQIMKMTLTYTAETYTVHELLNQDDPVTPCDLPESATFDHNIPSQNVMHVSEAPGSDLYPDSDGFWRLITRGPGRGSELIVDAGPILHRAPCLGYVFTESGPPNRRVVILGDTHDPSAIASLCMNPAPSLLIHEATDAPIPSNVDKEGKLSKRAPADVQRKAILRGHSTPSMAGEFAKSIGASALVLNHIGGRFPAPHPRYPNDPRATIMREIERQAGEAWGAGRPAVAATDFLRVEVPVLGAATFSRQDAGLRHGTGSNTSYGGGGPPSAGTYHQGARPPPRGGQQQQQHSRPHDQVNDDRAPGPSGVHRDAQGDAVPRQVGSGSQQHPRPAVPHGQQAQGHHRPRGGPPAGASGSSQVPGGSSQYHTQGSSSAASSTNDDSRKRKRGG